MRTNTEEYSHNRVANVGKATIQSDSSRCFTALLLLQHIKSAANEPEEGLLISTELCKFGSQVCAHTIL